MGSEKRQTSSVFPAIAQRQRSNPMVLTHDRTQSSVQGRTPVLWRGDPAEPVELADALESVVDELPGTRQVRLDLAPVLSRATARAIEPLFCASCAEGVECCDLIIVKVDLLAYYLGIIATKALDKDVLHEV